MKKLLLPFFLCFLLTSVYCQEQTDFVAPLIKGNAILGGGIGVNFNNDNFEQQGFFIDANYGKFLKDRLVLGGYLGYQYNNSDFGSNGSSSGTKFNTFQAGLFMSRYFPVIKRFGMFLRPQLGYSLERSKFESVTTDSNGQILSSNTQTETDNN